MLVSQSFASESVLQNLRFRTTTEQFNYTNVWTIRAFELGYSSIRIQSLKYSNSVTQVFELSYWSIRIQLLKYSNWVARVFELNPSNIRITRVLELSDSVQQVWSAKFTHIVKYFSNILSPICEQIQTFFHCRTSAEKFTSILAFVTKYTCIVECLSLLNTKKCITIAQRYSNPCICS